MKKKQPEEKLLTEAQFSEVFLEYLSLMDELTAVTRNHVAQIKSIRYHIDIGLEEHPELCKRLYEEYEAKKTAKEAQAKQNLGNLG